jgi:hypothetical protein
MAQENYKSPSKKSIKQVGNLMTFREPLLLVRGDNTRCHADLWKCAKSIEAVAFVRIGVACPPHAIYKDILCQLDTEVNRRDINTCYHEKTIQLIISRVKRMANRAIVVIDNCHHLVFKQIFYLVGLMVELEGRAQFILLIGESSMDKFKIKLQSTDRRAQFFSQLINQKHLNSIIK